MEQTVLICCEKLHRMKVWNSPYRLKDAIPLQHLKSPTTTKVFLLHGKLKVRPLFLQRDSRPRLQAVSRNESIVKSDSIALMTGVLIGHHLGNIVHSCCWDWLPPAVLRMFSFRNVLFHAQSPGVFAACKVTGTWASPFTRLRVQSLLPNGLYKFNHVEGCSVRHQVLIRVREGRRLISSLSAAQVLSMKAQNNTQISKSDYHVCSPHSQWCVCVRRR